MILSKARCYLAGPCEFSKANWRSSIIPKLDHLNLDIYNPVDQPSWFQIDGHTQTRQRFHFNSHFGKEHPKDFKDILDQNKTLRQICLRLVAACDFIICRIDGNFTVGTYEEIKCAADQNKPVLFFTGNQPIDSMWRLSQFVENDSEIEKVYFTSEDGLIKYLDEVNLGLVDNKIKWANLFWRIK
jgi:nucleoside 2-deoxyribosyltransferase